MSTKRKNLKIASAITPKDFGPIKLYGIPHIRTKYIKDFEMDNFRRFIRSSGGGNFPLVQKKNSLKIASDATAGDMGYVTEKGFFLDGRGDAYMQGGGKFQNAGEYDINIHGLPVPLAQQMQINPNVAMDYDPGNLGGVVIPQDFSPLPFRYFQHIRTPAIRKQESDHFNNFIESMGGGLDKVQRRTPLSIG